jgi:hypothetical protein
MKQNYIAFKDSSIIKLINSNVGNVSIFEIVKLANQIS